MTIHGINDSMSQPQEACATWSSPLRISRNAYRSDTYATISVVTNIDNHASKLNEGLRQRLLHNPKRNPHNLGVMGDFVHM